MGRLLARTVILKYFFGFWRAFQFSIPPLCATRTVCTSLSWVLWFLSGGFAFLVLKTYLPLSPAQLPSPSLFSASWSPPVSLSPSCIFTVLVGVPNSNLR